MTTVYIAKFNDDSVIPLVRRVIAADTVKDNHNINVMFHNGTFEFTGDQLKLDGVHGDISYRILAERRIV